MAPDKMSFSHTSFILSSNQIQLIILSLLYSLFKRFKLVTHSISLMAIIWSTVSATNTFVANFRMKDQRILIAYPIMLFYASFVINVIF